MEDNVNKDQELNKSQPSSQDRNDRSIRSLMRLLVGGVLVGSEELVNRMDDWEQITPVDPGNGEITSDSDEQPERFDSLPEELPPPPLGGQQVPGRDLHIDDVALGLAFTLQERIAKSAWRVSRFASRIMQLSFPPDSQFSAITPPEKTRRVFDQFVARGEQEVNNWSSRGKQEKQLSKQVFNVAAHSTVDESIDYLTNNPELQELVQQQGTGLAEEIMEEVRERAFSLDTLFESTVRSLFRLKPRSHIPPPPVEVREHAEHIRKRKAIPHGN